jgi:hypothetical protein
VRVFSQSILRHDHCWDSKTLSKNARSLCGLQDIERVAVTNYCKMNDDFAWSRCVFALVGDTRVAFYEGSWSIHLAGRAIFWKCPNKLELYLAGLLQIAGYSGRTHCGHNLDGLFGAPRVTHHGRKRKLSTLYKALGLFNGRIAHEFKYKRARAMKSIYNVVTLGR